MASLYIKDEETAALAERLAHARGLTKTAAVRIALANELAKDVAPRSVHDIVADFRRTSPLVIDPDVVIDKAFWDSLNDEDDD